MLLVDPPLLRRFRSRMSSDGRRLLDRVGPPRPSLLPRMLPSACPILREAPSLRREPCAPVTLSLPSSPPIHRPPCSVDADAAAAASAADEDEWGTELEEDGFTLDARGRNGSAPAPPTSSRTPFLLLLLLLLEETLLTSGPPPAPPRPPLPPPLAETAESRLEAVSARSNEELILLLLLLLLLLPAAGAGPPPRPAAGLERLLRSS